MLCHVISLWAILPQMSRKRVWGNASETLTLATVEGVRAGESDSAGWLDKSGQHSCLLESLLFTVARGTPWCVCVDVQLRLNTASHRKASAPRSGTSPRTARQVPLAQARLQPSLYFVF